MGRSKAAQVIRETIAAHPQLSGDDLRRAVSAAYPFGERAMHPYKIWLSEVNRQLGVRQKAGDIACHCAGWPGREIGQHHGRCLLKGQ